MIKKNNNFRDGHLRDDDCNFTAYRMYYTYTSAFRVYTGTPTLRSP